ncbi:8-oxo-dGTP diphosphatase [Blastocladiella emersonii ATCC 22665]|nr:8-oxo-dGTP diphosphatase [Blastocladiella emersonii ATCC 22665]
MNHNDDAAAVFERLASTPPVRDAHPYPNKAAVLAGLVDCTDAGLCFLLTFRSAKLRDHAGEISFPGGKWDPTDATVESTAFREAHEEVGLAAGDLEYVTTLEPQISRVHSLVYPVVARLFPTERLTAEAVVQRLKLNRGEVAAAFLVPLRPFFEGGRGHAWSDLQYFGREWRFHRFRVPCFGVEAHSAVVVWGLSAVFAMTLAAAAYGSPPQYSLHSRPEDEGSNGLVTRWRARHGYAVAAVPRL